MVYARSVRATALDSPRAFLMGILSRLACLDIASSRFGAKRCGGGAGYFLRSDKRTAEDPP